MKVDDFDYKLPPERIANRPARPRDSARMLVIDSDRRSDRTVRDLPDILNPGDHLILNDTQVLAARIAGVRQSDRGQAKVEVTLDRPLGNKHWTALAKPARRLRTGDTLEFQGLRATVMVTGERGLVTLRFNLNDVDVLSVLRDIEQTPLPPYLNRNTDADDHSDYQTIFATNPGAVAAPTAGLHFTPELLNALSENGIGHTFVTLHVGAGTFLPVATADTESHTLHKERGEVTERAALEISNARSAGSRLVAVGTTVLRLMETAAQPNGDIAAFHGETDLFLTPGHQFHTADLMLTNFHLPRSTLFMLVCAFAGTKRMHNAYRHAIDAGYRFYSYGDCCLLSRFP